MSWSVIPRECRASVNSTSSSESTKRNTQLPSFTSVPCTRGTGVRMRTPLTSVPLVLARSLIVTVSRTRMTSAWMPLTARSRTRMSHSGRRPMICRPGRRRNTCPGKSPSSITSAGSCVSARSSGSGSSVSTRTSVVFRGGGLSSPGERIAFFSRSSMGRMGDSVIRVSLAGAGARSCGLGGRRGLGGRCGRPRGPPSPQRPQRPPANSHYPAISPPDRSTPGSYDTVWNPRGSFSPRCARLPRYSSRSLPFRFV